MNNLFKVLAFPILIIVGTGILLSFTDLPNFLFPLSVVVGVLLAVNSSSEHKNKKWNALIYPMMVQPQLIEGIELKTQKQKVVYQYIKDESERLLKDIK